MKKSWLLLIFVLPLLIAAFNAELGFQWLISKSSQGNIANDIPTTALAAAAFRNAGAELQAQQSLAWIKSKQDPSGCFPKGNCKIKETAFAHWLFILLNEDTEKTSAWLESVVSPALVNGDWWLQVATSSTGTCKVSYQKSGETKEHTITVNQGKFPGCSTPGKETFFDLNKCLEPNIVTNTPFIEFQVDCSTLGSSIISAVFQSGNTYYLLDEASTSKALIKIQNGCFGKTAKAACDVETSLYANALLAESGASLSVTPWLENNYDHKKVLDNALFFIAAQKEAALKDLKILQKKDGSFLTIYETAFAIAALNKAGNLAEQTKAVEWLKTQQKADGSWNSKELDTAAVLYTSFADTQFAGQSPATCSNGIKDEGETAIDCGGSCRPCGSTDDFPNADRDEGGAAICGDYICDVAENEFNCPQDCPSQSTCNTDGVCDSFLGESFLSCPTDCPEDAEYSEEIPPGEYPEQEGSYCGNNQVNDEAEECDGTDDSACPGVCNLDCTCEQKKSALRWMLPLIIILLIGLAVYYFFFMKKK
ncbi:MAG: hypothetical protein AABX86_02030 [Nanoarchaeota archaeon]